MFAAHLAPSNIAPRMARSRARTRAAVEPSPDSVNYFAFGSNVNPSTFRGRRNMNPTSSSPCVLSGYELVFSVPGLPYFEPAFAAVRPSRGDATKFANETHGVMYAIRREEWDYLLQTEGSYDVIDVTCTTYDGREVSGRTLTHVELANFGTQLPSKRYLELIREGAKHWDLDPSWRAHLDGLEAYEPLELDALGRAALALSIGPTLVASIAPAAVAAASKLSSGGAPRDAVIAAFLETQNVAWGIQNTFIAPFIGSGGKNDRRPK